jgi:integrase
MANSGKNKKTGHYFIQFTDRDGVRHMMRLAGMPKSAVETIRVHIEHLVHAQIAGVAPPLKTTQWLTEIGKKVRDKLVKFGLVEVPVEERSHEITLSELIEKFRNQKRVKPSTQAARETTHRLLIVYFGPDRPIKSITEGDAEAWREHIRTGRAENTIRKKTAIAKTTFNCAIKYRWLSSNPFKGLESSLVENKGRMHFVCEADAVKVMAACPDHEWRLIFALCRWGGLRCPSEVLALQWSDVNFETARLHVRSPKTEHILGHESRMMPMFPELVGPLMEVRKQAGDTADGYVIATARNTNHRTRFAKIIRRAGLTPWPKLLQNLRSTRETELCDRFPMHVVCDWIGNSKPVAMKHYLQTTDQHFAAAVTGPKCDTPSDTANTRSMMQRAVNRAVEEATESRNHAKNAGDCVILPSVAEQSKWAMRDSNPRHPRCKRGALTN